MRRWLRTNSRIIRVLAVGLFAACGGDGGSGPPTEPAQFGTVTGSVRGPNAQAVVGASVKLGSLTATSASNGNFMLSNVPVGTATVTVDAAGFDRHTQALTVVAGANTHDVALVRTTIFVHGDVTAYLPSATTTYRGVLYLLAGTDQDSRPFLRGDGSCWFYQGVGGVCPMNADFRVRLMALAEKHGLAVFGMKTPIVNELATYDTMMAAMADVGQQSGHPELGGAPIFLVGSSRGGCLAHGFTRTHFARVIGFISSKGDCHIRGASPASTVPGYFFVAEDDPVNPREMTTITELFLLNRAEGAIWALAHDVASGHEFPSENGETFGWMDVILTGRLPAGYAAGTPLPTIAATSGWLANRTTTEIAAHACFTGNVLIASWLPNEQTARDWQRVVGGSGVISCP